MKPATEPRSDPMMTLPASVLNGVLMLCDGVAHERAATPDEVAEFLRIEHHPRAKAAAEAGKPAFLVNAFAQCEVVIGGRLFRTYNGPGIWFGGAGF